MKKNEIIELNGVEYTLELNRDSFIQIDKICNVTESMKVLSRNMYDYINEIDDNYNPLENITTDDDITKEIEIKSEILNKLLIRSFFIWLYPNHKLPISKVEEIIKPYIEDDEKASWIGEKLANYLQECVSIRENEISKKAKAQVNNK